MGMKKQICDAVFSGGGIRGIGFVGAISKFEQAGYTFRNVAGTSAGAIVSALVASGFSAEEMYEEMSKVNFERFKQKNIWKGFGALGTYISATKNFGLYNADLFEEWLEQMLAKKNVHTFADLGGRLMLTACDVTDKRNLILPNDLPSLGINPDTFKVATAVRMSMSIPIYYEPYELTDGDGFVHYIVDGGIISNYPISIIDKGTNKLDIPVFGFRFTPYKADKVSKKPSLKSFILQIMATIIESNSDDYKTVVRGDEQRTVYISTVVDDVPIFTTDFGITDEQVIGLHNNGKDAAEKFLKTWDFKKWKAQYRNNPNSLANVFRRWRKSRTEDKRAKQA